MVELKKCPICSRDYFSDNLGCSPQCCLILISDPDRGYQARDRTQTCLICGERFEPYHHSDKFCTSRCRKRNEVRNRPNKNRMPPNGP